MTMNLQQPQHPTCVNVYTERIVEKFFIRFNTLDQYATDLLIVSPVLGTLSETQVTVEKLIRILRVRRIRTYLVTRSPDDGLVRDLPGHAKALDMLKDLDNLEIRYNNALHAKIYVCQCKKSEDSFALLGSANMTRNSIVHNIEVGVLIRCFSQGELVIHELDSWIRSNLRTNSKLHKPMIVPKN
jgi:phosphatidylserine/phosphatidylglycerophosphate/cardiolipin synthase-like enzyme